MEKTRKVYSNEEDPQFVGEFSRFSGNSESMNNRLFEFLNKNNGKVKKLAEHTVRVKVTLVSSVFSHLLRSFRV